jgi:hypothetical protein
MQHKGYVTQYVLCLCAEPGDGYACKQGTDCAAALRSLSTSGRCNSIYMRMCCLCNMMYVSADILLQWSELTPGFKSTHPGVFCPSWSGRRAYVKKGVHNGTVSDSLMFRCACKGPTRLHTIGWSPPRVLHVKARSTVRVAVLSLFCDTESFATTPDGPWRPAYRTDHCTIVSQPCIAAYAHALVAALVCTSCLMDPPLVDGDSNA